jgi:hypothetical protein
MAGHDAALITFNWEFQAVARRLAADLRRVGVKVHHALDGSAQHKTVYKTVILLLSQSFQDSPAACQELSDASDATTKLIGVVMEPHFDPDPWLAAVLQDAPLLYLLTEEQYAACLTRLRWESPLMSMVTRVALTCLR